MAVVQRNLLHASATLVASAIEGRTTYAHSQTWQLSFMKYGWFVHKAIHQVYGPQGFSAHRINDICEQWTVCGMSSLVFNKCPDLAQVWARVEALVLVEAAGIPYYMGMWRFKLRLTKYIAVMLLTAAPFGASWEEYMDGVAAWVRSVLPDIPLADARAVGEALHHRVDVLPRDVNELCFVLCQTTSYEFLDVSTIHNTRRLLLDLCSRTEVQQKDLGVLGSNDTVQADAEQIPGHEIFVPVPAGAGAAASYSAYTPSWREEPGRLVIGRRVEGPR